MASINTLKQNKNKFNSLEYQRCLLEGMKEWLDLKYKTGNLEIKTSKELTKEIKASNKKERNLSKKIADKMKSLGINTGLIAEFKGVFKIK